MRFTLQTLLLSVLVVWTSIVVFGLAGFVWATLLLVTVGWIRNSKSMLRAASIACVVWLLGCIFIHLMTPLETGHPTPCPNKLKSIMLALWSYEAANRRFPPAYIPDRDGKPMHSWRVLILPYMECEALYDQYDFSEPWDGPNNGKLAGSMPYEYCCPSSEDRQYELGMTNFVAVRGPNTAWANPQGAHYRDFIDGDGSSQTIMLVEIADSDIQWMEPRDLTLEEAVRGLSAKSANHLRSVHTRDHGRFFRRCRECRGIWVACAAGSVHFVDADIAPEKLEAMLTIDGREDVPVEQFPGTATTRLNWGKTLAPVALLASVILLLARPRRKRTSVARHGAEWDEAHSDA